jgi:hypothetical protein
LIFPREGLGYNRAMLTDPILILTFVLGLAVAFLAGRVIRGVINKRGRSDAANKAPPPSRQVRRAEQRRREKNDHR